MLQRLRGERQPGEPASRFKGHPGICDHLPVHYVHKEISGQASLRCSG